MNTITNTYHQEVIYRLFQTLVSKGKISQPAQILDTALAMFPEYRSFPENTVIQDLNNLLLT